MLAFVAARKEIKSAKSRPFYFSLQWASPISPINVQPCAHVLASGGVCPLAVSQALPHAGDPMSPSEPRQSAVSSKLVVHPLHRGRNPLPTANTSLQLPQLSCCLAQQAHGEISPHFSNEEGDGDLCRRPHCGARSPPSPLCVPDGVNQRFVLTSTVNSFAKVYQRAREIIV